MAGCMAYPQRLEITSNGLLVKLANYHTTLGILILGTFAYI